MIFLKKSLFRKLFLYLFFVAVVLGLSFYYAEEFSLENYVKIEYFLGALGVFSLVFLLFFFFDVVRPLRKIVFQMQLLIAGKPFRRIYTTRVDELGVISHFFNQVTKGIGKIGDDIKDHERVMAELDGAAELQEGLMPERLLKLNGLEVSLRNKPASELGGDSYNYFAVADRSYVYLGDATGHGAAAALVMGIVNSLISVFVDSAKSLASLMISVNMYFKKNVRKSIFMTMVMFSWDEKEQELSYVGAGHEKILIYRSKTGVCEEILTGGVALGMLEDNSEKVVENVLDLEDGDFVIVYTDGVTEAKNSDGKMYGLDALKKSLLEHCVEYSAEGVSFHIAKDVVNFMGDSKQMDDMSLIVMKRDSTLVADPK